MNLDGFALPVQKLKGTDPVKALDLSDKSLGVASGVVIASLIGVNGALTALNLSSNQIGGHWDGSEMVSTPEGPKAIADALLASGTLTKIEYVCQTCVMASHLQTQPLRSLMLHSVSYNNFNQAASLGLLVAMKGKSMESIGMAGCCLGEEGVKVVAEMASVMGALERLDVRNNKIAADGAAQLSAAVLGNLKIEMFNKIPIKEMRANSFTELDLKEKLVGVEGGIVIAGLIPFMGALTKLSLAENQLEEKGTEAICEALKQNNTLKELDLSGFPLSSNIGGAAGAKHVADMLGVNGGLMVTNLLRNHLDAESAKLLTGVAKQKDISLCGIRRDQTTADFSHQYLKPPDVILLASDLSQTVVTGGLTSIDLSENNLTNYGKDHMTGITELASALAVNGALTKCDLRRNHMSEEGEASIRKAVEGRAGFKLHLDLRYRPVRPA